MSIDMDDEDKNFLIKLFDTLKEDITEIRNHQKKTCDELATVDKNVVKQSAKLDSHLESSKKKETEELQRQKSNREKKALTISVISACTAIISVVTALFVIS